MLDFIFTFHSALDGVEKQRASNNFHINGTQLTFNIYGPYGKLIESVNKTKMNETREIRDDYNITPGLGAHKLHMTKITWNKARTVCAIEGGMINYMQFILY